MHRQLLVAVAVFGLITMANSQPNDNYTVPTTHTYKTVATLPIKADMYRLPGDDVRPVIVWIHGGALIMGQRGGARLAQRRRDVGARYGGVSVQFLPRAV